MQQQIKQTEKLLTANEVSDQYGLRISRIRSLVFYDAIPHFKVGKSIFFRKSEIEKWLVKFKRHSVDSHWDFRPTTTKGNQNGN